MHTWLKLRDVFLELFFRMLKKSNHKDKLNNFVEPLIESVSSSWEKFTAFVRGVFNNRIDDDSLKDISTEVRITK